MTRRRQSRGECLFCEREMTKGGLSRHLAACPRRAEVVKAADQTAGHGELLYHLVVQDAWNSDFWLHLEMRGSARLDDLDRYLRAIWLECCGHLSMFSIGGWGGDEIAMRKRAEKVFEPGLELTHIYDYGTSSYTLVREVSVRRGRPIRSHPIYLMARNALPEASCIECGEPAAWLCHECMIEDGTAGTLCEEHARVHPHDDYGEPVPLVNSPRLGMCGYTGPADPPY